MDPLLPKKITMIVTHLGIELTIYTLNLSLEYSVSDPLNDLSPQQLSVINELYQFIHDSRLALLNKLEPGRTTGAHLKNHLLHTLSSDEVNPFNTFRKKCGGTLATPSTEDTLLCFFDYLLIHEYPNFLFTYTDDPFFSYHDYLIHKPVMEIFEKNVKNDDLQFIVKPIEDSESPQSLPPKIQQYHSLLRALSPFRLRWSLMLSNGFSYHSEVLPPQLLGRAFHNVCNRFETSFEDFRTELHKLISDLRLLAKKEEITHSGFIQVRYLELDGLTCATFGPHIIRTHTKIPRQHSILSRFTGGEKYIIETTHRVQKDNSDPLTTHSTLTTQREQEVIFDKINYALILSSQDHSFSRAIRFQNAFALVPSGNSFSPYHKSPKKPLVVNQQNLAESQEWFALLDSDRYAHVRIPFQRLKSALYERFTIEDALVDTFVAWESIFSTKLNTSWSIKNSFYEYLKGTSLPVTKTKIDNLYELRCQILHGREEITDDKESEAKLHEAIDIALTVLKKLLHDTKLLSLSAQERVLTLVGQPPEKKAP